MAVLSVSDNTCAATSTAMDIGFGFIAVLGDLQHVCKFESCHGVSKPVLSSFMAYSVRVYPVSLTLGSWKYIFVRQKRKDESSLRW